MLDIVLEFVRSFYIVDKLRIVEYCSLIINISYLVILDELINRVIIESISVNLLNIFFIIKFSYSYLDVDFI